MKKTVLLIAAILILFSACDMAIPEKISVKTNANYNYSIGAISKDFSDTFTTDSLFSGLETENNKVYDFFPGQEEEKLQQYLLTVKVSDITISTGGSTPAADTDIPDTNLSADSEIKLDIKSIFASIKDVLGESFSNNAEFNEIPLYIYCAPPAGFKESQVKGSATITYMKDGTTASGSVTVGDSSTVIPYFSAPILNKTTVGKSENVVDNLLSKGQTSLSTDISDIINLNKDNNGDIKLNFDLTFSGKTSGEEIGILAVNAFIILPLRFNITSLVDIDLTALAKNASDKSNEDVFNRSEATNVSDMQKYLDVIEKIVINYKTDKNPIVTDANALYVIKSDDPYIRKRLDINEDFLKLNNEEFNEMLSAYPFKPDLNLEIPSGAILSLPRNVGLVMNMNIGLYTNGVINFK